MGLALSIAQREASLGTEGALIDRASIEAFLREVEARAYRIALVHMRDRDEALDIVQDSMIRLVQRYSGRPSEEWPPLFYRILQNRIRDMQRRRGVRARVLSFFGGTAARSPRSNRSARRSNLKSRKSPGSPNGPFTSWGEKIGRIGGRLA